MAAHASRRYCSRLCYIANLMVIFDTIGFYLFLFYPLFQLHEQCAKNKIAIPVGFQLFSVVFIVNAVDFTFCTHCFKCFATSSDSRWKKRGICIAPVKEWLGGNLPYNQVRRRYVPILYD